MINRKESLGSSVAPKRLFPPTDGTAELRPPGTFRRRAPAGKAAGIRFRTLQKQLRHCKPQLLKCHFHVSE